MAKLIVGVGWSSAGEVHTGGIITPCSPSLRDTYLGDVTSLCDFLRLSIGFPMIGGRDTHAWTCSAPPVCDLRGQALDVVGLLGEHCSREEDDSEDASSDKLVRELTVYR